MPMRPPIHRPAGRAAALTDENRKLYDRNRADQVQRKLLNKVCYCEGFRPLIVAERGFRCEDCGEQHYDDDTLDVHHVRGLANHPEDLCDPEFVKVLCHGCHSKRTARGE